MRRIGVLVNPTSGRGKGGRAAPEVLDLLRANGIDPVRIEGTDGDDALIKARDAVTSGLDGLVACGGDGTVHIALQAVMGHDIPLGVIPVGSGDDIARALGIPRKDVAAAVAVVTNGNERLVDVGEVTTDGGVHRYFLGVLSSGFDSMVNERANRMSFPPGQAKYLAAIIAELGVFKPATYHIELDGVAEDTDGMLVAVGNGVSYGGGMKVCPGAVIDDGLFSVVLLGRIGKPTFLRVFPRVFAGTHIEHPAVTERTARTVRLEAVGQVAYADGERIDVLPVSVNLLPSALRAFTP
ncbi:MAG: YegS/Rv2252/BmrU family lipid kinase [Actinobacteria bacterium]|nr:YegS/Rv2252/BmrU family lipid kinase [Actinomycetota bacterium]